MSAAVVFLLFFICLIIAIPISIALGIVSVLPGAFDPSFTASGTFVIRSMLGGIDSFPLLAVPMFVLSGMIMAKGGISKKIFDVFAFFIGKLTAGMPCAVIVTCLFYGAISGTFQSIRRAYTGNRHRFGYSHTTGSFQREDRRGSPADSFSLCCL